MSEEAASQLPPLEWPIDPDDYDLIKKIGQGAFATVWRAQTKSEKDEDGRKCAIKVLNLDHVDSNLSEIRSEVQLMRLSSHQNVLTCHAAFVNDINLWLITPLMRKGSSLHCLQTARREIINRQKSLGKQIQLPSMEEHIFYIMHETLLGLQYIHTNGQIHRDIKAGNILLDGNGDVKIADFGVSGWLVQAGSQQEKAKTFVGTPCWMAPEVMEQVLGYDYKADIWSLGITALELAKGYAPYAKYPPMKVLILTIQEDPPSLDSYDDEEGDDFDDTIDISMEENFSKSFRSFVAQCLQKNPSNRPNSQELLNSKYFSDMSDACLQESRRDAIRTQVCDLVADVGSKGASATATNRKDLPGNKPVSIVLPEEKDRPAGTTWIFSDGSQILSSSATNAATVDDVMTALDDFGKKTGGEDYSRSNTPRSPVLPSSRQAQRISSVDEEDEDDLNKFMDDFELTTGGEDFQRP